MLSAKEEADLRGNTVVPFSNKRMVIACHQNVRVFPWDSVPSTILLLLFSVVIAVSGSSSPSPSATETAIASVSPTASGTPSATPFPTDLRKSIINGNEPCFNFIPAERLFEMNCSTLDWHAQWYGPDTHISLGANEIFDGDGCKRGTGGKCIIDLSGVENFKGLFTVRDMVASFGEAPLIKNVHVRNGKPAESAGFVVRAWQEYFVVDSCSSTGDISQYAAGGICGRECGHNSGIVQILNSYSTGMITGGASGGITGETAGSNGGSVNITRCYSTGSIEGNFAGGMCGWGTGHKGEVFLVQCYSTGSIDANFGGGIVGLKSGINGYISIRECYSTGAISGKHSGGITGSSTANNEGEVHIVDCYTRGDINGEYAGGITGAWTGSRSSFSNFGDVYISNTYASGVIIHGSAGGIIGSIYSGFTTHTIHVQYSVYNNKSSSRMVGNEYSGNDLEVTGNSNDLGDIQGRLYHFHGTKKWDYNTWALNGTEQLPILRFQLEQYSFSAMIPASKRLNVRRMLPVQVPARSVKQRSDGKRRLKKDGQGG